MYRRFFKRLFDIIISLVLMIFLLPVLAVIALLVKIKLGSPVIFRQPRPGRGEKIFTLYKFRSMSDSRDEDGELLSDEERLSSFGKKLRDTSLDELPEIFNILKGDMSFVGPRPQLVRDMVFMTPEQRKRHNIRPGLTGLAQINGRNCISWEDKLSYDLEYIDRIRIVTDIHILAITFIKVAARDSISNDGMATAEDFGDYLLRTGKIDADEYDKGIALSKKLISNPEDWRYYKGALLPALPPHKSAIDSMVKDGRVWKMKFPQKPYFARWTTDFDCGTDTGWWYCIKDTPYDLSGMKAKRRYEIVAAERNFETRIIDPSEYSEAISEVFTTAYKSYGQTPSVNTALAVKSKDINVYFGAFSKDDGKLCGYAKTRRGDGYISIVEQKALPEYEKKHINAAIVAAICREYSRELEEGSVYLLDGERNILHDTFFQEYLCKYFGFRYAYARLHIKYRPFFGALVKAAYPFRKPIEKTPALSRVSAILKMEQIIREQEKTIR